MSIRKRGSGWQVRVEGFPDVTLPKRAAAEKVELNQKLQRGMGASYEAPATTFGHELDSRLDRKKAMGGKRGKLRPATEAFYEQSRKPWQPLDGILVPHLRRAHIEDHIAARAAIAPVAARNELQFAKATLRDAESRGQQVDGGIFAIEAIHHEPAEGRALTIDELETLAAWLPERIMRIAPFCGLSALRWSEAVHLDDRMVDLQAATVTIPRALNKSRREKAIPLAAYEVQLLREQMLARTQGASLLFPNARGGVYSKSGFRSVWTPAVKAAGLDGLRFHDLRHTATSLMCKAGMRPEYVALRRGDSDGGALVLRLYRHLYPGEATLAVGAIDELMSVSHGREVVDARG